MVRLLVILWILGNFVQDVRASFGNQALPSDFDSIQHHPTWHGQYRFFAMATDNAPGLRDYYALASALEMHMNSRSYRGFALELGASTVQNVGSSKLIGIDPLSLVPNRYEIGLFDVLQPGGDGEMNRIEALNLHYHRKNLVLKLGRQGLKTPFINPQDGRMRPTLVSGLTMQWNAKSKWEVTAALLHKMAPRSTTGWYSIGESIGKYPSGVNPDGVKSGYSGNLTSRWIGLLGVERQFLSGLKLQCWNQWVDQIFNTTLTQVDFQRAMKPGAQVQGILGVQSIVQQALQFGGNAKPEYTYMMPDNKTQVWSFRAGLKRKSSYLHVNYTRISSTGRYLMPREWGRDPMYTFMPRERIEGNGNVRALTVQYGTSFLSGKWHVEGAVGRFALPDVHDALNKYGMPSFYQMNVDVKYTPGGHFSGLELQWLYVIKRQLGNSQLAPRYLDNKVNLSHLNFIVNYHF